MKSINRTLVETMVRMALADMKRSPERSLRNLVDLGVNFAHGPFQQQLLQTVQTMLQDDNNPYYTLMRDIIVHVDSEALLRFGMNLGYNSCCAGARTIRETEDREGYNVPWSVFLDVGSCDTAARKLQYRRIFEQGAQLGIYTWQLFSRGKLAFLLDLAAMCPDCAFIVYCTPAEITPELMDRAASLQHVMLVVEYTKGAKGVCAMLRERAMLYAIYATYADEDLPALADGSFFTRAQSLHPAVTILFAQRTCGAESRAEACRIVQEQRQRQCYGTLPWDGVHDTCFVDTVISEDMCSAGFDENGWLFTGYRPEPHKEYDVFRQPLARIFAKAFPKHHNTAVGA